MWLVVADDQGRVLRFVDDVRFGASANGESFGRAPNGTGSLAPMMQLTLGAMNSAVRVGPVLISEVAYRPGMPSAAALIVEPALTENDLEFIEIYNPTSQVVLLADWRIRGGVDFDFLPNSVLAPGESLVVLPFDPTSPTNLTRTAAFRTHYGIDDSVRLTGGFDASLSDTGQQIVLQRPDGPPGSDPTLVPYLIEDEVYYDDLPPWPSAGGVPAASLQRGQPAGQGSDPASWFAGPATPGQVVVAHGDLNGDGQVTADDIDFLCAALHRGDSAFDLNGDGQLGQDDLTYFVQDVLHTNIGDADLDGDFDSSDFVAVFQAGEYEDGVAGNSTWAEGDWDCDGDFSSGDFVAAFQAGRYETAASQPGAVPAAVATAWLRR